MYFNFKKCRDYARKTAESPPLIITYYSTLLAVPTTYVYFTSNLIKIITLEFFAYPKSQLLLYFFLF